MSTFILNKAYGINCVQYKSIKKDDKSIVIYAEMKKRKFRCKKCRNNQVIYKDKKIRKFKMIPLGNKRCFLKVLLHKVKCSYCGYAWWIRLPFMKGKSTMVRSFIRYTLDLLCLGTIQGVSKFLNLHWNLVKKLHKEKLKKLYKSIHLENIEYITVDEVSIKKGHNYMTIFADLKTGRIIHSVEGRDLEAISPFLKTLAIKAHKLKAIAMDMSKSYSSAVKKHLPNIDIVFDHFHVNAVMNKALDDIRKNQYHTLSSQNYKVLKGNRFLLLKNYDDLSPVQHERINKLFEINKTLFIAHALKEQFRSLWHKSSIEEAKDFLLKWCLDALLTGIKQLKRVVKMLARHQEGIFNYFKHRITSGKAEGINNKIKTMFKQAYGFRDMEYLKLRLYNLHNQKPQLVG